MADVLRLAANGGKVTGDGAYNQDSVFGAVTERDPAAMAVVPPRATAVPSEAADQQRYAKLERHHHQ
jgi:hypothetical protein